MLTYTWGLERIHPINILPNLSKVYERLISKQIPYFDAVFSKFQCRFWKRFKCATLSLNNVEKWRKTLNETAVVSKDLSEAFGCTDRSLLIAKLNAYDLKKCR